MLDYGMAKRHRTRIEDPESRIQGQAPSIPHLAFHYQYHASVTPIRRLLSWSRANSRDLPWRGEPREPYRVLVSELMLQQTQVDRVVPRFVSFLERFPTLRELASAPEDAVLEAWSGLGYYSRARRLHSLACRVTADLGELPEDPEELLRLPGIGPYTAAAVASMAFDRRVPVVDGNVIRVAARVMVMEGDPRRAESVRRISGWVLDVMNGHRPGEVNEALMELGATVCLPLAPRCGECPLAGPCRARELGRQTDYPPRRRTRQFEDHLWIAACGHDERGRWLLHRVTDGPILRGLWLPPFDEHADESDALEVSRSLLPLPAMGRPRRPGRVRHSVTHRRIRVVPVLWLVEAGPLPDSSWRWVDPEDPKVPTSSLLAKLLRSARDRA